MTQTTTEMKSLIVRESKDLTIAQKLARRALLRAFSKARFGRLTIADGEDTFSFEALKQALRHTSLSLTHRSGQMSRSGGQSGVGRPSWPDIG